MKQTIHRERRHSGPGRITPHQKRFGLDHALFAQGNLTLLDAGL